MVPARYSNPASPPMKKRKYGLIANYASEVRKRGDVWKQDEGKAK
jgi:hypothetical protein